MDLNNIENLEDVELYDLQNQITEIIKKRNHEKVDIEVIIKGKISAQKTPKGDLPMLMPASSML